MATHSNTPGGGAVEGGIEFDSNSTAQEVNLASSTEKEHTKVASKPPPSPREEDAAPLPEHGKEEEEAPLAPSEDLSLTRAKRRREERLEQTRKRQKTDFGETKIEQEPLDESADSRRLSLTHSKSKSSAKKSTLQRRDSSRRGAA